MIEPSLDPSERPMLRGSGSQTILVVDDDKDIRDVLADVLAEDGYRVRVVENGLRLVSMIEIDRPALILMDVMMSWANGFDLCRALKRNERFREIPVAFLSGKCRREDVLLGQSCGAVEYFQKPLDLTPFLDRVREIVSRGR